jgi:serine phosphatase RsbU (regulator of sigma subunit)
MGGDFYAYYVAGQPDSLLTADPTQPHYTIVVGDVTDKGIPAALLMAVSLSSFRSIVAQVSTPAELLARLDDAIIDYTRTSRQNCALVYLGLDRSGTTLYAANAGCIAPFIKRCRGAVEQLDVGGIPLGIELGRESGYQTLKLSVEQGDIIVLTSDGVIEAQNGTGQMFGFERWAATIEAGPTDCAEAMLNHLRQAVLNFMGDVEQHDDITIVVVRV